MRAGDGARVFRQSIEVDDVSFASSSQLSHSIKNLDMSSILKHRHGHKVSFQTQSMKQQKAMKDLHVDDVSLRSSGDLSENTDSGFAAKPKTKKTEVELDLPSDGASTFRDFVPREV